jgi:hypothetical protein
MASEILVAHSWLDTTLRADAALAAIVGTRIYEGVAPQGTAYPFVVFQTLSTLDYKPAAGGARVWTACEIMVKVIVEGESYSPASAAYDRIDALIKRATGTIAGGTIIASTRESALAYGEESNGKHYRHLGGTYRITARAA